MATSYLTPGVYVEEVPSGARPIEAVGTSTAAFLGAAPNPAAELQKAVAVNNWSEFLRRYVTPEATAFSPLAQAVHGFFLNGGSRCYVVNVGPDGPLTGRARPQGEEARKKGSAEEQKAGPEDRKGGLELLEAIDEIAIVAAPGYVGPAAHDALLTHCEQFRRFAVLDLPELQGGQEVRQLTEVAQVSADARGAGKAAAGEGAAPEASASGGLGARVSNFGAAYFPGILARNALNAAETVRSPPSGYIAGIYARTDAERGVHKAPANEIVRGALGVTYALTPQEQGALNPNGVNCIRFFPSEGVRVWGARTRASDAQWRYVPVRRLFNMIEKSIGDQTSWVVFEPNDASLWKRIKRDLDAFLTVLWRQGALMGRTAEQAFFVQCDEETNPPEVIDRGQVVIVVGIAPVKPAEFVIFRIGQGVEGTQVETVSA